MNKPKRIQRKRTAGWRTPPDTVNVSRPSRWGNPFKVVEGRTQGEAVDKFRAWLKTDRFRFHAGLPKKKQWMLENIETLRGKDLACFCKPGTPCHADILMELANHE